MPDTLTKKILTLDMSVSAGGDILIPGNWSKYYSVVLSADWTGLNAADMSLSMLERSFNTQAWKVVTSHTCASPAGSQDIQHGDFGSKQLAIRVTAGSVTAGSLIVYITTKSN
jgi:hypothetical protein